MNTEFSRRKVKLNNCSNNDLARIFNDLVDAVGQSQRQIEIDTETNNLSKMRYAGSKLIHYTAESSKQKRVEVLQKICKKYGFDIENIEKKINANEEIKYYFTKSGDFINNPRVIYLAYYWGRSQTIATAIMEIAPDWKNVTMISVEDGKGNTRSELKGDIKTLGSNLFFILQDTEDEYYALISLFIGGTAPKKRKFLTGTFSSASTSSGAPTAGKMILEKQENKQAAILKAKQTEVSPVIFNELFSQRMESIGKSVRVAKTLSDFPSYKMVTKLKIFAGIYKGQYLHSSKRTFNTLIMQIYPNGRVRFKTVYENENSGMMKLVNDSIILFGQFEKVNSDEGFRFFMVFKTIEFDENKVIDGIYGGKGRLTISPMAGRIRLQQINPHSIDADNAYDRLNPKRHSLLDIEELRQNVPNIDNFIRFFKGEEDNFMESAHLFEQLDLIQVDNSITENTIKSTKRDLSGVYTGFCLSSYDNSILKYAVKIDKNGKTVIKDLDEDVYYGVAKYTDSMMTILIDYKNNNEKYSWHTMFYMGNSPISSCHHLVGVSSKPTKNKAPSGRLEVLYIENDLTFEQVTSGKIEFPSDKFNLFNKAYKGLGTYLIGEAVKIIKSPRKTDYYYPKPKLNYGYVFFAAACEACRHHKISEAEDYLDKAKNNGYSDFNTIALTRSNKDLKEIHPFIDSLWVVE